MEILRGDLEITKNVVEELVKKTNNKLEEEIRSGLYETDYACPSHDKMQGLVDTLVVVDQYKEEHGFDKR